MTKCCKCSGEAHIYERSVDPSDTIFEPICASCICPGIAFREQGNEKQICICCEPMNFCLVHPIIGIL